MNADAGLRVHRDSRTETLAAGLVDALARSHPENPLAAQTVVVAHPGLKRWLLGEFARRGERGIAANFDMILPWQWLERCARVLLGDAALIDGAYRTDMLRWAIYAALPSLDAAPVRAYLRGDDPPRRCFQLAEHLAGVYTQYLIYRADWIAAWERGEGDDWQAVLWRELRHAIVQPHRAQRRDALLDALARHGDGEALPLHVFGVSHLPPDVLDALHVLSRHREVHLYFPDPCRHYWADLRRPRELFRLQPDGEDLHYEIGHPLLVSLGRMAQDFFIRLDAVGAELDAGDPGEATDKTLLGAVQESIRDCRPGLVGVAPAGAGDASLRVHACHTRLRELEVLKDALLGFLADDTDLQHRDIVVMAPDIGAYAPYLRAVFGEPARYSDDRARIPWHLADVRLANTHPLLAAFGRVLDLADSRFTVSEVLDLLDVAAFVRRFGFDADVRASLERALRGTHVAWGLDAAMKEQAGAAAVDRNSWAFGLDRLYAGLIAGGDGETFDVPLLDGVLPASGIGGGEAEMIGCLGSLLEALRRVREGYAEPRPLPAWRDWLLEQVETLFAADPNDVAEANAVQALRRAIAQLGDQAEAVGRDALPWSVMREAVRAALDAVSERQAFLLGGVTFCGLVPQRSIPFKVVCLLGMNEGEFPRRGDSALNRMLEQPRRGDRDTRREDRYLFLEALMAARERLHLSYIGEGVRDAKPRNPASPLAELLQFLDERHNLKDDDPRPWLVHHPLQPFDARYFDAADPRLFTFERAWEPAASRVPATPFVDFAQPRRTAPAVREIALAWLRRFWRDPAKAQLRDGAGVSLEALDADTWPDREPLDVKPDRRERTEQRLFDAALAARLPELPGAAPDWLARAGALPAGAPGEQAYAQARAQAQAMLDAARRTLGAGAEAFAQAVDLELGDARLTGAVAPLWRHQHGILLLHAKPGGTATLRDLLTFYIDFACAKLAVGSAGVFVEFDEKLKTPTCVPLLADVIVQQEAGQLRDGLRRLVELTASGELLFPPKTAWEWMRAKPHARENSARLAWEDRFRGAERGYSHYAALLARDADFLDPGSPAHAQFAQACAAVADVLDPEHRVLMSDGGRQPKRRSV